MTHRPHLAWILASAMAVVSTVLAGCNSLSSENETQLTAYLDNAEQYFDGGDFERAYQQWGKALELDPSNEGARLGQAMSLFHAGRENSPDAMKPLVEATTRLDKMRHEDFGKMQWKVELGVALVHQRWCYLYDLKTRKLDENEKKGVPVDPNERATVEREFQSHLETADAAFRGILSGEEQEPRDRLTCWIGLAQISYWRHDPKRCLEYCNLYLAQVVNSKRFWESHESKETDAKHPANAAMFHGKFAGAQLQEADLRDLMGGVLLDMDRGDDAVAQFDQVVKMFPERASTYYKRGLVRQKKGDDDFARADFTKFLSLTELPDNDPMVIDAGDRLNQLKTRLAEQEARDAGRPPADH